MATRRTTHPPAGAKSGNPAAGARPEGNGSPRIEGAVAGDAQWEGDALSAIESSIPDERFLAFLEETSLEQLVYWKLQKFVEGLSLGHESMFKDLNLLTRVTDHVERSLFLLVLKKTQGNLSVAAKVLGCNRNTLHRKLKEYALTPLEFRKRLKEYELRKLVDGPR